MNHYFPTDLHQKAANRITSFFSAIPETEAVLLTCSCARGVAIRDSCLDIAVLYNPASGMVGKKMLHDAWLNEYKNNTLYKDLRTVGTYSHVDLEFIDGVFTEKEHYWTGGPDEFELEIGNFVAYSVPLFKKGDYFEELKRFWLPYYDDERRARRLTMAKTYCLNNLDHVEGYVERKLFFQCFSRIYHALGEFLQSLFICERVYPVAYDKWIADQLTNLVHKPELYKILVGLMEYGSFESNEHIIKAETIRKLLNRYCCEY